MIKQKKKEKVKFPVKSNTTLEIHCPKLQKDLICDFCLSEFKEGDRIILVGTHVVNKILKQKKKNKMIMTGFVSEYFYHIACWRAFYQQSIKESVQEMQKQVLNNPAIKQIIQMFGVKI